MDHPEIVTKYVEEEVALGRMLGPLEATEAQGVHISRFGVIPKSQPGKWRLITDLSHPPGGSVNDGIEKRLCSLQYVTVEMIAQQAVRLGRGALVAKLDVKSAYRLIPVHPHDRPLLGVRWKDQMYVDKMLPFGLRSAPKIFTAVADALEWCIRRRGVQHVEHYLDDFATYGPPQSTECQQNVDIIKSVCDELGVPLAEDKLEGPTTKLTLLGIEIDTVSATLRLPEAKLNKLQREVAEWAQKRSCTRKELESFIGTLQFACRVIPAGRSFLRHMIASLSQAKAPHHHIRLNRHFRGDLAWWAAFARQWNGVALLPEIKEAPPVCLATDASGGWGCGGWSGSHWFQLQWPRELMEKSIAIKELVPIVIAVAIWGQKWARRRVLCHCDNAAVVAVVKSRYSKEPGLMHMLRCIFFMEAHFACMLSATHVPGAMNTRADELSRNRLSSFLSKVPSASRCPSYIPQQLVQLITETEQDWTSPHWTQQFITCVRRA